MNTMTEDYCKLVSGIVLSTIWREDDHTRLLWITMLAVKGRDHVVRASVPGLAAVANIPIESCRAGLAKLAAPDPDSRTKEHQGRRIQEVEGGWWVINGEKYRNFLSKAERNEYQARLMADRRAKEKKKLAPVSTELALLAHTEAEADTEYFYPPESRVALHYLNEKSGRAFRETATNLGFITARLKEPGVTIEGIRKMIDRQCQRWLKTDQSEYLRPETLFNRTKFDGYYAAKDQPVYEHNQSNAKPNPRNVGVYQGGEDYGTIAQRKMERQSRERQQVLAREAPQAGHPPSQSPGNGA